MTDRFRLDGQIALVNGASRGIGKAIAVGLAEAGATLALAARSTDALRQTAQQIGGSALVIPTDMRDPDQARLMVSRTVAEFGRIDILVNAAGVALRGPGSSIQAIEITDIFASNFNGIAVACAEAGNHFLAQQSGRVINIASLASFKGVPGRALYGATKAAIAQLTRTLAVEWGPNGTCVNAIAPGWIETDFTRDFLAQPQARERIIERTPLRRIGQPDDIVGLALFLASPAAAFVTGQVICCDGGYSVT
jgi:NAD(P)-dependent dehydrogenase (short-subunit alcohol dehydrogenase family)